MSRLFLIRHAQASFLSENYDQLSDHGIDQAKILGESLASNEFIFDRIYSGTLNRQQHTRRMVEELYDAQKIPFPKVIEEDRFNEYPAEEIMTSLGKYLVENDDVAANLYKKCNDSTSETERHLYFQKLFELILESWVNNDIKDVNLSTSWKDWSNGVRNAIDDIRSQAKNGELIGVFTSGGPIGVSVQTVLDAPEIKAAELNWRVYNCSVTKFTFSTERFSLDQFNDVSYLSPDFLTYR
tara:strand:+ start:695 stop:1414 length:720 start_codon:yes stop_codon:yes gene_type:complete